MAFRSGKSSIQKVVFSKLAPHETYFLLSSQQVETQTIKTNDNIYFNIVDFPGNYVFKNDLKRQIENCGALIYVIDAQSSDYETACVRLRDLIKQTSDIKPDLNYEVFIHKVDSDMFMTDDQKSDCLLAI